MLALASTPKGGTLLGKLKSADLKTYLGVLKEVGLAPDLKAMNRVANSVYGAQLEAVIEDKGFADDDTWAAIDAQVERAVVRELRQQTKAALHTYRKEQLRKIAKRFIWVAVLSGSCESCEKRHGKVKTMKQWEAYGEPGSAVLKCQKECRCSLLPADAEELKEMPPSAADLRDEGPRPRAHNVSVAKQRLQSAGMSEAEAEQIADPAGENISRASPGQQSAVQSMQDAHGRLAAAQVDRALRAQAAGVDIDDPDLAYPSGDQPKAVLERTRAYSYRGDVAVNRLLRGSGSGDERGFTREQAEALIDDLDTALYELSPRTPEAMTAFRGGKFGDALLSKLEPGAKLKDPGYSSTSLAYGAAEGFSWGEGPGRRVVLEIDVPKGVPALPMYLNSRFSKELELLLPRGTAFEVVGKTKSGPEENPLWTVKVKALVPLRRPKSGR